MLDLQRLVAQRPVGRDDTAADGEWRGSHPGERYASALTGMRTAGSEAGIAAGAPFDGKGRVETLAMPRYAIDAPAMNTAWFEGGTYPLRWRGAEPAEVALSLDAGRTFSAPARVPGSADPAGGVNGSSQGLLMRKLAVNAPGAVAIVNSSCEADARSRVWLLRGSMPR